MRGIERQAFDLNVIVIEVAASAPFFPLSYILPLQLNPVLRVLVSSRMSDRSTG